ncbi:MAG: 16S rRNA processing protein RimM [Rhodospirillales bacterium]|nr:16S rRNA processing protein RimM [Alphaproteobacteria bacterium]MCB1840027.1 16S rRNA processing protein RimM [Alphaproteobacteria bacterium]MCB9976670.1 16S rRNA processing protein RimM [Rhodospirillales bacterium]
MTSPSKPHAAEQTKRVCLGKIVSAHGVKGLVKLLPYGEDPTLMESLGPLFTGAKTGETLTVTIQNAAGKTLLAAIEGCTNRNQAEELRGTELWVIRDLLPEIEDENEFYIEDLIGLEIRSPENLRVGTIRTVENFGGGDLLNIQRDTGTENYVLFRDQYVEKVNLDEGFLALTEDGLSMLNE